MLTLCETITLKITVIGDAGVGKTSLLYVLVGHAFPTRYIPTIFEGLQLEREINKEAFKINIWDTAGQDEYDRLRPLSYSGANIIFLCFALDCQESFQNVTRKWIPEIRHYAPYAQIFLIGTKYDMYQHDNPNHVSYKEAQQLVIDQKLTCYTQCSAKENFGIDKIFNAISQVSQKRKNNCKLL